MEMGGIKISREATFSTGYNPEIKRKVKKEAQMLYQVAIVAEMDEKKILRFWTKEPIIADDEEAAKQKAILMAEISIPELDEVEIIAVPFV